MVRTLVKRGDTVLDVGANIGYIATRLAHYVGLEGRVYAWEPVPTTYELLTHVVDRLKLSHVIPVPLGASDCNQRVTMQIPQTAAGGADNLYESKIVTDVDSARALTFTVDAQRIDDWKEGMGIVFSFVKIDVEGHEGAAIRGMMQRLADDHPALLIELSGDPDVPDQETAKLVQSLESLGYSIWYWKDEILKRRQPGDRSVDYFFLTDTHLEQLRCAHIELVP